MKERINMAFDLHTFDDNDSPISDLTSLTITADSYVSSMRKTMDRNSINKNLYSLIDACAIRNVELVKELISVGHDVNDSRETSELTFPFKLTPLLCAKGHPELIIILIDAGADPYFETREGISVFNYMSVKDKEIINLKMLEIEEVKKLDTSKNERRLKNGI